jgi:hypothetical protein
MISDEVVASVGGCLAAAGVLVVGTAVLGGRRVDTVTAVRRLSQPAAPPALSGGSLLTQLARSPLVSRLAHGTLLSIPRADLALLGVSAEGYIVYRLATAALGLLLGPLLTALILAAHVAVPLEVPAGASLVFAGLLWFSSGGDVARRATKARRDAQYHLLVLLDQTALEISASSAPLQALERAAARLPAWSIQRIRDVLTAAKHGGVFPWDGLEQLGHDIALPALTESAGILRAAATEGTAAYGRLTARVDDLRAELLAAEEAAANAASEQMVLPMTVLVFLFIVLISYPLVTRIH